MPVFTVLTSTQVVKLISDATCRVVYVAPGVTEELAAQLIHARHRLPDEAVSVVLDCSPMVRRLGYGTISAVDRLLEANIVVRKVDGIRIGTLIVDDAAWVFAPTAQLIEDEPVQGSPNAVPVFPHQVERLVESLVAPPPNRDGWERAELADGQAVPGIGFGIVTHSDVAAAKEDLERHPPQQFDLARPIMVFESFIEYADIRLVGCHLRRRSVSIPPSLFGIVEDESLRNRLSATFRLLSQDSEISSKALEKRVKELRTRYLVPLGDKWGSVILREKKMALLNEVEKVRNDVERLQQIVYASLDKEVAKSRVEITRIFAPIVKSNPPPRLYRTTREEKPTDEEVNAYLRFELQRVMPSPKELTEKMELFCTFKGVTYETLTDSEFLDALASQNILLPKPFLEYRAAREQTNGRPKWNNAF